MLKVTINGNEEFLIENGQNEGELLINGEVKQPDLTKIDEGVYHLLSAGKGYRVEVMEKIDAKHSIVEVNGNRYTLAIQDRNDLLLQKLGMDVATQKAAEDIKAPMPGLVLQVLVQEGAQISKDDTLLILEAMKMENVLKAAADGVIDKIQVQEKDTVEKGQVLITFK